ncbi:MAG: MarR family transcriptional regulator [Roseivirga sp.]
MGLEQEIKQGKQFDSEYEKLIVNLIYTNSWLSEQQLKTFKPFGITAPQYNVLRILRGQYPEPCTVNTIIDRMLDRMSNASRIVDRLESKGLVERKVCKTDRRAKDVVITERGLTLLDKVDEASMNWIKRFRAITAERVEAANQLLDDLRAI